jgi:hypothetical protein
MLKFSNPCDYTDKIKLGHFNWRLFSTTDKKAHCLSIEAPNAISGGAREIYHKFVENGESNQTITPLNFAWGN